MSENSVKGPPFDLHVLSTPPAFVLSQDQTLNHIVYQRYLSTLAILFAQLFLAVRADFFRLLLDSSYFNYSKYFQGFRFVYCSIFKILLHLSERLFSYPLRESACILYHANFSLSTPNCIFKYKLFMNCSALNLVHFTIHTTSISAFALLRYC